MSPSLFVSDSRSPFNSLIISGQQYSRSSILINSANAVNYVAEWSSCKLMQLNATKYKELVIDFKKFKHHFESTILVVSDKNLTVVHNAKILGLTISNNLTWNTHIGEIITKANKSMYFLVLLRNAGVPSSDIVNFYCTCVRPLLEYCAPVFHHAIPSYLREFKRGRLMLLLQGTVIAIILPALASKPYRVDVKHYV